MWTPELPTTAGTALPLYLAIVRELEADMGRGRLRAGDRLPTHRELARALSIATGTVTRAYAEAERRGLVHGEVGRGTFVGTPSTEVVELGTPERTPPEVVELAVDLPLHAHDPDLGAALRELGARPDAAELQRYHDPAGTPRHRSAGAAWARTFGVECEPDRTLVCAGAQHALTVALLSVAEPGDLVCATELSYPGLAAIAERLHLVLAGVPMDAEGILPDALEQVCRKRRPRALYCVPSHHNPTTACLSEERRAALVAIAERYGLALLEDDVHRRVVDEPPAPLAARAPHRTWFVASLSKAVSAGLRVAYLVPPEESVERASRALWASTWMVPSLNAEIAAGWIADGTVERVVAAKRAEAAARQALARELLDGSGARVRAQRAGYYLWLELPSPWTSEGFARACRTRGVAVTPSTPFAIGRRATPSAVRVCVGAADDREQLARGLERVARTLEVGASRATDRC